MICNQFKQVNHQFAYHKYFLKMSFRTYAPQILFSFQQLHKVILSIKYLKEAPWLYKLLKELKWSLSNSHNLYSLDQNFQKVLLMIAYSPYEAKDKLCERWNLPFFLNLSIIFILQLKQDVFPHLNERLHQ